MATATKTTSFRYILNTSFSIPELLMVFKSFKSFKFAENQLSVKYEIPK